MTVGGVCKLEAKNLCIFPRLLHTRFSRQTDFLGFDNRQREIAEVVKQEIGAFLLAATHLAASDDDAAIGERALFANGVWGN